MAKSKYQVYGSSFVPKRDSDWDGRKYDRANKGFKKVSKPAIAKAERALSRSSKNLGSFRLG